jgi:hypothetical protein
MNNEPELPFEQHKLVRNTDPNTSVRAACSLTPENLNRQHKVILYALRNGPLAPEQIEDKTGETIWRRMNELEAAGLIEDTGDLHTNRSGRRARIFKRKDLMPWDY